MTSAADTPARTGSPQRSPPAPGQLPRINTTSSDGSSVYAPLPPGRYTVPIHGSCPRCHHFHQAATVKIRISARSNRKNRVNCEECGASWLALGGGNSTTISLLSQETTAPDPLETDFRNALISIVRSATLVASPTALTDVPESVSRVPSRNPSIRSRPNPARSKESDRIHIDEGARNPAIGEHQRTARGDGDTTATNSTHESASAPTDSAESGKRTEKLMRHLRKRLSKHFPFLKRLRLGRWKFSTPAQMSAKKRGKLAVTRDDGSKHAKEEPSRTDHPPSLALLPTAPASLPEGDDHLRHDDAPRERPNSPQFDETREMLKRLSTEQRIAWVRAQVSAFKSAVCRCSGTCQCRRTFTEGAPSTLGDDADPAQPSPSLDGNSLINRDPSLEHLFAGLGTHFLDSSTSTFGLARRPLSLTSTNFSQAPTMVDNMTVTSGPRNSYLDVMQQQRSQSRPPRPRSVPAVRFQQQRVEQDDIEPRSSMESFTTGGAVGGSAGARRRDSDGNSVTSPPRSVAAASHGRTSSLNQVERPPEDSAEEVTPSTETPHINGTREDHDQNQSAS